MKKVKGIFKCNSKEEVILNSSDREFVERFIRCLKDFGFTCESYEVTNLTGTTFYVAVPNKDFMLARAFKNGYCYGKGSYRSFTD